MEHESAKAIAGATGLTAKFLQARISTLTTMLVKRLENIFAAALNPDVEQGANETNPPPSYVTTATEQFQLDVESTALVRAAEEIMVLTRSMKDLWLFGGLDTLRRDENGKLASEGEMGEDRRMVEEFLKGFLAKQDWEFPSSDESLKGPDVVMDNPDRLVG